MPTPCHPPPASAGSARWPGLPRRPPANPPGPPGFFPGLRSDLPGRPGFFLRPPSYLPGLPGFLPGASSTRTRRAELFARPDELFSRNAELFSPLAELLARPVELFSCRAVRLNSTLQAIFPARREMISIDAAGFADCRALQPAHPENFPTCRDCPPSSGRPVAYLARLNCLRALHA